MKVLIADDAVLVRDGLAALLSSRGVEVAAVVGDADHAIRALEESDAGAIDVVILDIRMPPTHTDEGIRAACRIRRRYPAVGVLVLSQYVELPFALRLVTEREAGTGYLLKERVTDVDHLLDALDQLAEGGTIIDRSLVDAIAAEVDPTSSATDLTDREWAVLALMAEGRTDRGIAEHLCVSVKTVESHVGAVFRKLGVGATPHENRRVRSVLWFLRERAAATAAAGELSLDRPATPARQVDVPPT